MRNENFDGADDGDAERNEAKLESNAETVNGEVEREWRECKADCESESSDVAENRDVEIESQKAENTDSADSGNELDSEFCIN